MNCDNLNSMLFDGVENYGSNAYMTGVPFDTLSTARRLRERGFPQEHAEAIADELRISTQFDLGHLATREEMKAEFALVRSEIGELRSETKAEFKAVRSEIGALRSETKAEFALVRSEMKAEIRGSKAELLKWYVGIAMFQTVTFLGGIIGVAKILHP